MSSWKARLLIMLTILAMLLAISMGPAIANDGSSDDGVGVGQTFGASDDDDDDDDNGDEERDVDVDVDRALGLGPANDCFIVTVEEDEDGDEELDVWLVCVIDGRWVFVERLA